ncbi:MAG: hypothetical protein ACOC0S_05990 [Desulfohalobiaceae bacterium]
MTWPILAHEHKQGDHSQTVGGEHVPSLLSEHSQGGIEVKHRPETQKSAYGQGKAHRNAQHENEQQKSQNP